MQRVIEKRDVVVLLFGLALATISLWVGRGMPTAIAHAADACALSSGQEDGVSQTENNIHVVGCSAIF